MHGRLVLYLRMHAPLLFARTGRMATAAFTVRKWVSRTLAFSHEPSKAQIDTKAAAAGNSGANAC